MANTAELRSLLALLREYGVTHFAQDGLELHLAADFTPPAPPETIRDLFDQADEDAYPELPRTGYRSPSLWRGGNAPGFDK